MAVCCVDERAVERWSGIGVGVGRASGGRQVGVGWASGDRPRGGKARWGVGGFGAVRRQKQRAGEAADPCFRGICFGRERPPAALRARLPEARCERPPAARSPESRCVRPPEVLRARSPEARCERPTAARSPESRCVRPPEVLRARSPEPRCVRRRLRAACRPPTSGTPWPAR